MLKVIENADDFGGRAAQRVLYEVSKGAIKSVTYNKTPFSTSPNCCDASQVPPATPMLSTGAVRPSSTAAVREFTACRTLCSIASVEANFM
jgi:hypothetical protein